MLGGELPQGALHWYLLTEVSLGYAWDSKGDTCRPILPNFMEEQKIHKEKSRRCNAFSYRMPFLLSYPSLERGKLRDQGSYQTLSTYFSLCQEIKESQNIRVIWACPCPIGILAQPLPKSVMANREMGEILQPHALKVLRSKMKPHPVLETTLSLLSPTIAVLFFLESSVKIGELKDFLKSHAYLLLMMYIFGAWSFFCLRRMCDI